MTQIKKKGGRPIDLKTLFARLRKMIEFQEHIAPFTPTVRELAALWDLHAPAHALYVLRQLTEFEFVITRTKNGKRQYFANNILLFQDFRKHIENCLQKRKEEENV